jgi:hypothetical protein
VDATPNLGLPYILAAQSQKHVTHNEAIRALDAIVQLSVLDRDLAAPPGSPANGARYIVAASPTGAWSGHAGDIAAYQDGAWAFYDPVEGFIAWVADEDAAVVWNGSAWTALTTGSGGAGSFSTVGVNATADATNKLAVAAAATLLNHNGAGHQLKINKASASDTASLLYQDALSGRAELGLAGDDNFHFKVSADGSTWKEAIVIDRTTGAASFPLTPGRQILAANRTYYVRTDGSDSNTGLANTSGGAFLTVQKALNAVASLDLATFDVTIQLADGTYTGANTVSGPWLGSGVVSVQGNTSTPANVVVDGGGAPCFWVKSGGRLRVTGLEIRGAVGLYSDSGSAITVSTAMRFGTCAAYQMYASLNGTIKTDVAAYTICGTGAIDHLALDDGGIVVLTSTTVSFVACPAFSGAFASANGPGACLRYFLNTFSYPTVTITIASPGVVTYTSHGLAANAPVSFSTSGSLPTGLTAGTTYYVKTVLDANTFTVSATSGGSVINTSGTQSGTHKLVPTGSRYSVAAGGFISVIGAGANYLPGNAAGSDATGGAAGLGYQ